MSNGISNSDAFYDKIKIIFFIKNNKDYKKKLYTKENMNISSFNFEYLLNYFGLLAFKRSHLQFKDLVNKFELIFKSI